MSEAYDETNSLRNRNSDNLNNTENEDGMNRIKNDSEYKPTFLEKFTLRGANLDFNGEIGKRAFYYAQPTVLVGGCC